MDKGQAQYWAAELIKSSTLKRLDMRVLYDQASNNEWFITVAKRWETDFFPIIIKNESTIPLLVQAMEKACAYFARE